MKNRIREIIVLTLASVMLCVSFVTADSGEVCMQKSPYDIYYNNSPISRVMPGIGYDEVYEYKDTTYVQLRPYMEFLGKQVVFDEDKGEIHIYDRPKAVLEGIEYGIWDYPHLTESASIIEVIAHPEKYVGNKILVSGIIDVDWNVIYLFLTKEDRKYYNIQNSLILDVGTRNPEKEIESLGINLFELDKISGQYVQAEGVVEINSDGRAYLKDISYIGCLNSFLAD